MHKDQPTSSDVFTILGPAAIPDLQKLLSLDDLKFSSLRVQQFSIWAITDNPYPSQYVEIGSGLNSSGPDESEIDFMKILFERAGIDTGKYLVFK